MSRIEEALRKAREAQQASEAVAATTAQNEELASEEVMPAAAGGGDSGEEGAPAAPRRLSSSREITRMDEPNPLPPSKLAERRIIHPGMQDSRVFNAYRQLRTTVLQQTGGRNAVLLVSSVAPRGGASFVSRNLAAAIALDPSKTALVVDCHLQRPGYGDLLDETDSRGLTDYLTGATSQVDEIIHPSGIARMRVLPVGRHTESWEEYFTLGKMRRLVTDIKRRYRDRFVILDAPSPAESADVSMLAELADYALLVVPFGRCTDIQVESSVQVVNEEKLLGTVFNDEPRTALFD